jgi:DedD protein
MAFFNFRRDGSNAASNAGAGASAPETADVVRRRAKHRLIGSAVLVLAGVVGFPLLFDTQPRPVAVDIPIEIPGKGTVKPLVVSPSPANNTKSADKSSSDKTPSENVAADASLAPKEEILSSKPALAQEKPAQAAIKNEAKQLEKPEAKAVVKAETKSEAKPTPQPATATAGELRLIVQVGAFADGDKARDARIKLEKAGLKTYTQVAETSDGKRTRVRVGPFASKAEADKAASKIKTLGLPAAILTL